MKYSDIQAYVKDKDFAVTSILGEILCAAQSMFRYVNLPDTIPPVELERILMEKGHCVVTEHNGDLYAFNGGFGGCLDEYERPTEYNVTVPYFNISRTYYLPDDAVLVSNNTHNESIVPLIARHLLLYIDTMQSLDSVAISSRITMILAASDSATKQSADLFLEKIQNGEMSVIGESAMFDGIKFHTAKDGKDNLTQLIECLQYAKASIYNSLGLNANWNNKRERLTSGEVEMNVDTLLPIVDNMLSCRQRAVELINEKYGTDIEVHLASSWKLNHESAEHTEEVLNTTTSTLTPVDDEEEHEEEHEDI